MRESLATHPRKVPKQERSKATVEAILEATVRVLVREGYGGATTSRIAEVSGYGIGSLYDYFPNKEFIVAALIERHAKEMTAAVESNFRAHADSPLPQPCELGLKLESRRTWRTPSFTKYSSNRSTGWEISSA